MCAGRWVLYDWEVAEHPQPPQGLDWFDLVATPLDHKAVNDFLVRPDAGATVVFTGTTRDHAGDRAGVDLLTYEAYESGARPRLAAVLAEARVRWPEVTALVALHRIGEVPLCEPAVIVGASSPHRGEAFAAAHFCIDALKATVPIWKRERYSGGEEWGLDGSDLVDAASVGGPPTSNSPGPDQ